MTLPKLPFQRDNERSTFNLNKFREEVQARLALARDTFDKDVRFSTYMSSPKRNSSLLAERSKSTLLERSNLEHGKFQTPPQSPILPKQFNPSVEGRRSHSRQALIYL